MKRQCDGCGNGGDWALKLNAQQVVDAQLADKDDPVSDDESQHASKRISVLFYVADEREEGISIEVDHAHGHVESKLFSSGHHSVAGDWQLHVTSSSKL